MLNNRRGVLRKLFLCAAANLFVAPKIFSKTYLNTPQAQKALWGDVKMTAIPLTLSSQQAKLIKTASKVRVRHKNLKIWKTESGGWFIVDNVIGKHENIDYAVALTEKGKVKGIEIMVYRETYGHQIMNPKWRAQFNGRGHESILKLDKQIKNISGATLSCRHITDGINRLVQTWKIVISKI
ncbi:MAG: FMN-binding protein [Verrucomicrobiales bacterium]|nr:FMN-binding protein [Verrucomicrobiales bacterium]